MARNNRLRQPSGWSPETIVAAIIVGVVSVVVFGAYGAWWLGCLLRDGSAPSGLGVMQVVAGLAKKEIPWPGLFGWVGLAAEILAVALAALAVFLVYRRATAHSSRVDHAAPYLGRGRDVDTMTVEHAEASAQRLHVDSPLPGIKVGAFLHGKGHYYMTYEDMMLVLAGPRTGKTTSLAIPAIMDAPGPVLTTSNKRDIVDAVRGPRSRKGRVYVFDPQQIVHERQDWWWNPLSYVTDDTRARKLAGYFSSSVTDPNAKKDAYFDSTAETLLTDLLLAAALDGRAITDVWRWLMNPVNPDPQAILSRCGYPLNADELESIMNAPDKQQQGVYGSAMTMARVLTNREATRWVTPPKDRHLDEFVPERFVLSDQTLCSMSREGAGTAGGYVLALTAAVSEAAEEAADLQEGGRLAKPMLGILDEAANVCRWRELPDLYSHFGSRGILFMTFLQSWSQGVGAWTSDGMEKLWSASNVISYLGGIREPDFLDHLSKLLGEYDYRTRQVSFRRSDVDSNVSVNRDTILSLDELAALPRGRELLLASGSRPVLARTEPWMARPDAGLVRSSIGEAERRRAHARA